MLRSRRQLFVLFILLITLKSAHGQKELARPNDQTRLSKPGDSVEELRKDFIKSSEEYKASLQTLVVQCESDAKKRSEDSAKFKELYSEGLISRREYETRISGITEVQVRIDELRKQIKSTEITIAEARGQPHQNEARDSAMEFQSQTIRPWTTGNDRIDTLIRQNGVRYGVDAYFIYCVMQQESRFSSTALSVKGAQGLMQLMPGTAARYGVMNVNDPAQNIMGGTRYLKDLLRLFSGRIDLVLAAYNAGEGAVIKYGQTVPPYKETRDYVRLISLLYHRRRNSTTPIDMRNGDRTQDNR
jgi:hypothetical protein